MLLFVILVKVITFFTHAMLNKDATSTSNFQPVRSYCVKMIAFLKQYCNFVESKYHFDHHLLLALLKQDWCLGLFFSSITFLVSLFLSLGDQAT